MPVELQTIENNTPSVMPVLIRNGIRGNVQTIYEMVRITRKMHYDLGLQALAADILLYNNLDSNSERKEVLETVFNFVAKKDSVIIGYNAKGNKLYNSREKNKTKYIAYVQDVAGDVENIKDARRTIADGFGDCDDHAILNASLLGALGFEDVRFAMAKYAQTDESFSHVYAVVYVDGVRYVFDTTLSEAKLGNEAQYAEIKEIPVFEKIEGFDGFNGFLYNAKHQTRKFGKAITEIIPQAVAFLPLGFISGNALALSSQLVTQSATNELSYPNAASKINRKLDEIIVELIRSQIPYDLAKSYALQVSAQINAITNVDVTRKAQTQIQASIKERLNFISEFPRFAAQHNIKLVYLNAQMILLAFLGIASASGYAMYKYYKG